MYSHVMLGCRGKRFENGAHYIKDVKQETERLGTGVVTSVIDCFGSLNREENWDRIKKTYRWLVEGRSQMVSYGNWPGTNRKKHPMIKLVNKYNYDALCQTCKKGCERAGVEVCVPYDLGLCLHEGCCYHEIAGISQPVE